MHIVTIVVIQYHGVEHATHDWSYSLMIERNLGGNTPGQRNHSVDWEAERCSYLKEREMKGHKNMQDKKWRKHEGQSICEGRDLRDSINVVWVRNDESDGLLAPGTSYTSGSLTLGSSWATHSSLTFLNSATPRSAHTRVWMVLPMTTMLFNGSTGPLT